MSDVVRRLSEGQHPVVLSLRPDSSMKALRECLDRRFVHIKFTGTRGGTELGVPLDVERSDLASADLDTGTGRLTLVGDHPLDHVTVRCIAEVELPALSGHGRLESIQN